MSSNGIIPKEQLTAFERWELADFSKPKVSTKPVEPPPPEAQAKPQLSQAEIEQELALLREQARQQAYEEGYAEGYKQGQQVGEEEGLKKGMQHAHIHISALQEMMSNLQTALEKVDEEVAQSLLDLALEVANKMICSTLDVDREIIFNIVSEAINTLPHFNQHAHLILHQEDAKLVREHMSEQLNNAGWKIFTDNQLERGGCRLETNHSQVDASNEARWHRIVESIGSDKSWKR